MPSMLSLRTFWLGTGAGTGRKHGWSEADGDRGSLIPKMAAAEFILLVPIDFWSLPV